MDLFGELFVLFLSQCRRLHSCVLLALAASGFILWLVPSQNLGLIAALAVVTLGVIAGVLWERANR
jgi:hypothetical protein